MQIPPAIQSVVAFRAGRPHRPWLLAMILCVSVPLAGCVTTLGYVPEHLKPADSKRIPTYEEVKKWAYDVVDGYDSRATMNRYAIYGGALVGAAALSAVAGLAAFDAGSAGRDTLIGLPIGMGFLGSVAAIYSSEEKARIYGLASKYAKDLVVQSDDRLRKRRTAAVDPVAKRERTERERKDAETRLARLQALETQMSNHAATIRKQATDEPVGPRKDTLAKNAEAAERLAAEAKAAVQSAKVESESAKERETEATRRHAAWQAISGSKMRLREAQAATEDAIRKATMSQALKVLEDLQTGWVTHAAWQAVSEVKKKLRAALTGSEADRVTAILDGPNTLEGAEAGVVIHSDSDPEVAEASCLQRDINEVMRRVGEHIALLDPKNVVERLREVRAAAEEKRGEAAAGGGEKSPPKLPPADLSDLMPPVRSLCAGEP